MTDYAPKLYCARNSAGRWLCTHYGQYFWSPWSADVLHWSIEGRAEEAAAEAGEPNAEIVCFMDSDRKDRIIEWLLSIPASPCPEMGECPGIERLPGSNMIRCPIRDIKTCRNLKLQWAASKADKGRPE